MAGGTYADWWNEQQRAKPSSGPLMGRNGGGPVRLTISRGAYKYDATTGQLEYEEVWEEEQLMEEEEDYHEPDNGGLEHQTVDTYTLENGSMERLADGGSAHEMTGMASGNLLEHSDKLSKLVGNRAFSLMVLDTNVLMGCLSFLKHIFSFLFTHNTQFLLGKRDQIAPFALIIPKTVLRELDGLKTQRGNSARRPAAQQANRWILQALRAQKQFSVSGIGLPEALWALHVQTQEHSSQSLLESVSNDERIVSLSVQLQRQTGLPTILCSADVNARLAAEADGLISLDLEEILKSIDSGSEKDDKKQAELAETILSQWTAQLRPNEHGQALGEMEADIDLDFEDAAIPSVQPHQPAQQHQMDAIEMMVDSPRIAANSLPPASGPSIGASGAKQAKQAEEAGITASRWAGKPSPFTSSAAGARKRRASLSPPPSAAGVVVARDAEGLNPIVELPQSDTQSWSRGERSTPLRGHLR